MSDTDLAIPEPVAPEGRAAFQRSERVSQRWKDRKLRPLMINTSEYAAETQALNTEQCGALVLLMMFYSRSGMLPRAHFQLASIAKVRNFRYWRKHIWPAISRFVVEGQDDPVMPIVDEWHDEYAKPKGEPWRMDVTPAEWQRLRSEVFARDNFVCRYCGEESLTQPHCDHVIPRSQGGLSFLENLVTSCGSCNIEKGGRTPAEWRAIRAILAGDREP